MSVVPVFSIKNVSFSYGNANIFRNLNLDIFESDFVALTGANGAGKSTVLKLLLGEVSPKRGRVLFINQPVETVKDWTAISYAGQDGLGKLSSFPANVFEIVRANLVSRENFIYMRKKFTFYKVMNALKLVGLEDFENRKIDELSGGQMQKVLLARCLISEPKILILEEPTNGLDQISKTEFYELLTKLNHVYHLTVILVSHDVDYAKKYASRFILLRDGLCYENVKTENKE